MTQLFIGLMSGTSLDGVDGVVVALEVDQLKVLAHANAPLPSTLTAELLALNRPGPDELHRAALAANALMHVYATVVAQLLASSQLKPQQIKAIGAHGQTVRHQPQMHTGTGYTWQLANPALLAELTGIDVVADFRSRDVAAGGQGAPLVPVFHQSIFDQAGQTTAVLNLGGMANLTVIGPSLELMGFDCGPGNVLMDAWCQQNLGQPFDANGAWAASGQVHAELLHTLLAEPFFALAPPKSTGRDLFNRPWLDQQLEKFSALKPQDIQATLLELTASACAACVRSYAKYSNLLIVCGGGAFNLQLMHRLQALLPELAVEASDAHGLAAMHVEAAAFAWLAQQTLLRRALDYRAITGAQGPRVLGAIYPA